MSTARARSALITWGAVLFSGVLLVTACTGDPVATGTVPVTPSVVSTSDALVAESTPSTTPMDSLQTSSQIFASQSVSDPEAASPRPVIATVPTNAPTSPAAAQEPSLDVPAGAHQKTVGGAEDFAQWWFQLGSASLIAGSDSTLEKYSSPNCSDCNDLIARNANSLALGESVHLQGDSWVDIIQSDKSGPNVVTMIIIRYVPPIDYLSPEGSVSETTEARAYLVGIDVEWNDDHWVLSSFRPVES